MTYPLTVPERLLTWLDVERVLKQKTQLWSLMPEGSSRWTATTTGWTLPIPPIGPRWSIG